MPDYPYPELPRYFADALGIRTAYYAAGTPNGRPVVFLHGMSTSADSFRETMHELADAFWLLAPDIPGFGYSGNTEPYTMPHLVEWLAGFRQALDLPPMALVGHSFGGILAVTFALSYPEDVTRLLLVAPAILSHQNYPALLKKMAASLRLLELGSAVSQSPPLVNRQIRVPFHDPDAQHESVWQRRLDDYQQARASASVLKSTAFHDLRPRLGRLRPPVCIVWGENDPVVPMSDADVLAEMIPDVQVYKLARCGHAPMLERQKTFQEIARQFLVNDRRPLTSDR
ncbi:MAG TPA: alpha/beta fold hydrolase [Anaerolineae bacterium]